jgi:hypothetical protein
MKMKESGRRFKPSSLFLIIVSKKKKHKFSSQKAIEQSRRELELNQYGKLVSLRPSVCHRDKTKYTRKKKHGGKDISDSYE